MADAPVELLAKVALFSELKPRELKQISEAMRERTVAAGQTLTTEGEEGVGFFVIESGTAQVSVGGQERRLLGPGDYFGEIALIIDGPRTATITAQTPVRCWGLTSWDFRPLVRENAAVAWRLVEALAKLVGQS